MSGITQGFGPRKHGFGAETTCRVIKRLARSANAVASSISSGVVSARISIPGIPDIMRPPLRPHRQNPCSPIGQTLKKSNDLVRRHGFAE